MRIAVLLLLVLSIQLRAGPGPLSATGEANLVALARLVGIVQHFHPSDAAAEADWNAVVVAAVARVETLSSRDALISELRLLAGRYAPTALVGTRAEVEPDPSGDDAGDVLWWRHRGFGRASFNGGIAESERRLRRAGERAASHEPATGETVVVELAPDVWCSVPLTVAAEAAGAPSPRHDDAAASETPTARVEPGLTVMGEPTGGTNGNVFNLKLPGDVVVSFTGAHVRHADGARLYGVGCVPDRAVHRTIDGVANGEDEILDRSIEWLETQR